MLRKIAQQTGRTPRALKIRPTLYFDMAFYYEAFWELSSHRTSNGMGPNPLALTEIVSYCSMYEVDDKPLFARFMRACDATFIEYIVSKNSNG